MNIYSIYKITNKINNKIYIGFTQNIVLRIRFHQHSTRNQVLYHAIRKYGWNNFSWEVIYQSTNRDHTLNVMEPFFISEHNSFIGNINSHGYNMTAGGNKNNAEHCISVKQIIAEHSKQQWQNSEYRNKMSIVNQKIWTDPVYLKNKTNGWEITTPEKEIIRCVNLAQFCRDNHLDDGTMVAVSKGNRAHHKGFTCRRIRFNEERKTSDHQSEPQTVTF